MNPPTAYALPMRSLGGVDAYDAIVVGGGPAGCLAAIGLARLGRRVAIVDRGPIGRDKCCGHCLHPRALQLLEQEGLLESVEAIASGRTEAFTLVSASGRRLLTLPIPCGLDPGGLLVRRDRLDRVLWEIAEASGVCGLRSATASLESVDAATATIRLETRPMHRRTRARWRAPLVVAADGVGSGIARDAGLLVGGRVGRRFGFSAELQHADRVIDAMSLEPGRIAMVVDAVGYLGIALEACSGGVHRAHAAAVVGMGAPQRAPQAFTRSTLAAWGGEDVVLESISAVGPLPWRPRSVVRGPIALAGDAAGFSDPITGEGMTWAFESASALVESVGLHRGWTEAASRAYAARLCSIARSRRRCDLAARATSRPGLLSVACDLMRMTAAGLPPGLRSSLEQGVARRLLGA